VTSTYVASLLVAAGLTVGVLGFREPDLPDGRRCGPVVRLRAVVAAAIALVPRRWQRVYLAGLGGWLALGWANAIDFTAVGHALALAIRFACVPLVARWRASDVGHRVHSVSQRIGAS
jgi:hypothetical protein